MRYLDHEPRVHVQAWQAPPVTEATGPLLEAGRALVRALAEPLPRRETVWQTLMDRDDAVRPVGDAFLDLVAWRHDLFLIDDHCVRVVHGKLGRAEAVAVYPRSEPLPRSSPLPLTLPVPLPVPEPNRTERKPQCHA